MEAQTQDRSSNRQICTTHKKTASTVDMIASVRTIIPSTIPKFLDFSSTHYPMPMRSQLNLLLEKRLKPENIALWTAYITTTIGYIRPTYFLLLYFKCTPE